MLIIMNNKEIHFFKALLIKILVSLIIYRQIINWALCFLVNLIDLY